MAGDKVVALRSGAAIRQMRQIEAEARVQLMAEKMRRCANAERCVAELTRLGFESHPPIGPVVL
jgi:hypothetical protein